MYSGWWPNVWCIVAINDQTNGRTIWVCSLIFWLHVDKVSESRVRWCSGSASTSWLRLVNVAIFNMVRLCLYPIHTKSWFGCKIMQFPCNLLSISKFARMWSALIFNMTWSSSWSCMWRRWYKPMDLVVPNFETNPYCWPFLNWFGSIHTVQSNYQPGNMYVHIYTYILVLVYIFTWLDIPMFLTRNCP